MERNKSFIDENKRGVRRNNVGCSLERIPRIQLDFRILMKVLHSPSVMNLTELYRREFINGFNRWPAKRITDQGANNGLAKLPYHGISVTLRANQILSNVHVCTRRLITSCSKREFCHLESYSRLFEKEYLEIFEKTAVFHAFRNFYET